MPLLLLSLGISTFSRAGFFAVLLENLRAAALTAVICLIITPLIAILVLALCSPLLPDDPLLRFTLLLELPNAPKCVLRWGYVFVVVLSLSLSLFVCLFSSFSRFSAQSHDHLVRLPLSRAGRRHGGHRCGPRTHLSAVTVHSACHALPRRYVVVVIDVL